MNDEQRLQRIEKRLDVMEHSFNDYCTTNIKDKYELKDLIRTAVEDGNNKILIMIKDHDNRLNVLEHSEATKALEKWKSVCKTVATVAITFIITLLLNNIRDTLQYQHYHQEQNYSEVQNDK